MWIMEKWREFANWIDRGGKLAWVAATVIGFMIFWPIGLIMLFNLFTRSSDKMVCKRKYRNNRSEFQATGNSAFDEYRRETLERLEREKEAFDGFLERLREARDRKHFDDFMNEYKTAPKDVTLDQGAPA